MTVTIKDIAKELGLSIATVSRVLNNSGYASKKTRERVIKKAKELQYQPNAIAKSLKLKKTHTIGLIVPDLSNLYYMKIAKGIEDTLQNTDYSLIIVSNYEDSMKELKLIKMLNEKRIDVLILTSARSNNEVLSYIRQVNIPIILIDRKIHELDNEVDMIYENNFLGAYNLANYILSQSKGKIGVINGPQDVITGRERYEGFKSALTNYNIPSESVIIYEGTYLREDGGRAAEYFMKQETFPESFISFNNTMTEGFIEKLIDRNQFYSKKLLIGSYGEIDNGKFIKGNNIASVIQYPYEIGVKVGEIVKRKEMENIPENDFENDIINPGYTFKLV